MVHVMHIHETISNANTTTRRSWERQFIFVGWHDGWYVLHFRAEDHPALEIHALRKRVLEWLIEQTITPGTRFASLHHRQEVRLEDTGNPSSCLPGRVTIKLQGETGPPPQTPE
jgi:hypothetical protein